MIIDAHVHCGIQDRDGPTKLNKLLSGNSATNSVPHPFMGARMLQEQLNRGGISVGRKHVGTLMKAWVLMEIR